MKVMSETRQWNGYVCPDCRMIFRAPSGREGAAVVCSGCQCLLRLPRPGEVEAIAAVAKHPTHNDDLTEAVSASPDTATAPTRRRHRHEEEHAWETGTSNPERVSWKKLGFGAAAALGLLGMGSILAITIRRQLKPQDGSEQKRVVVATEKAEETTASLLSNVDASVRAAEPTVRKFLAAKTIEEILPTVRNPELAKARMEKFYPGGRIQPEEIVKYNLLDLLQVPAGGEFLNIGVRNADFIDKLITTIATPQGFKVDWESWVGWSETSASEFLSKQPEKGSSFRVTLSAVSYYNYNFKDDREWKSFRIRFGDSEKSVFGYVKKGSILEQRINLDEGEKTKKLILSLKFPASPETPDQVLIDDFIHENWVEGMPN